jgi:hypothetical protein
MQEVRSSNLLSSTLGVFSQVRSLVSARTGSACRTDKATRPSGVLCCPCRSRAFWVPMVASCVVVKRARLRGPLGFLAFSQFRHGVKAGLHAGCVISGVGREPPPEHAATSPEVPPAVLHIRAGAGQEACGQEWQVARLGKCRIPEDLLSWRSSEVTAGCLGEGRGSHSRPLRPESAGSSDRAGRFPRVSARQPVTNQVTALPGLLAARVHDGIAGTCASFA